MWNCTDRIWPDIDTQVIGIVRRDGFDEVAWWTRTNDGWYVSETSGNVGHRDAMCRDDSKGPHQWCHAPRKT